MEKTEKKNCENCRYFLRHYIRSDTFYLSVNCGHCVNPNLHKGFKKKKPFETVCELWEPYEVQIAERKKKIKKVLFMMADEIKQMATVLNDDEADLV